MFGGPGLGGEGGRVGKATPWKGKEWVRAGLGKWIREQLWGMLW